MVVKKQAELIVGFLFGKKSKDVETDLNRSFYEKQVGITKGSK